MKVGGAVHRQAGHAVEEVSEGQVDYEDGGVLQRGSVEAQYLVGLSPGNGEESEEVPGSSYDCHDDAENPRHGGQHRGERVVGLRAVATVTTVSH